MDETENSDRRWKKEEVELKHMDVDNQLDDSVNFSFGDAEWGDAPISPLPTAQLGDYYRQRYLPSVSEDGSLGYTNAGFQDYQRQQSNTHSPFDSDTVFLFNRPGQRKDNIRQKLATWWCTNCVFKIWQRVICTCSLDCSCRDQTGVHCVYRLKQKAMRKLKLLQGILCLVTIILSGMVFLPLGNITASFDGNCLLYSNLFINKISKNNTVTLDIKHSQFGSIDDCNFTTFINVVVAVVSLFFVWFFIHTSYVSGLEQSEMKLQLPVLLCYFILLVAVIVSSFKITIGFNYWCYNIMINNPMQSKGQRFKCRDYETLKWSTDRSNFYTNSVLAEVSTWLLVLTLVLQLSVTVLHLYQNIKAAYDEIEVPHLKLVECHDIFEEEEQSNYEFRDALASLDCTVAPLPVYVVEYKKHQVLAKVVVHNENVINQFDLKSTLVLDKEKFKRNIGFQALNDLRSRRKVDFPLKMEQGWRRRRNWTGSCEELPSQREFNGQIKQQDVQFHEWHGFDSDVTAADENCWVDKNSDWHVYRTEGHKAIVTDKFEWPSAVSNSQISAERHGFENDFVNHGIKRSFSLPEDWQTFEMNYENQILGQFQWDDQVVETDTQIKDPWAFETLSHQTNEQNNDSSILSNESFDNLRDLKTFSMNYDNQTRQSEWADQDVEADT